MLLGSDASDRSTYMHASGSFFTPLEIHSFSLSFRHSRHSMPCCSAPFDLLSIPIIDYTALDDTIDSSHTFFVDNDDDPYEYVDDDDPYEVDDDLCEHDDTGF